MRGVRDRRNQEGALKKEPRGVSDTLAEVPAALKD